MEEKKVGQILTLEEMFDIFEQDVYKEWRVQNIINIKRNIGGYRYINTGLIWQRDDWGPMIYRHIVAEQLLNDYREIDWSLWAYNIQKSLALLSLWMNPLVWASEDEYTNMPVFGSIAKEHYMPDRKAHVMTVCKYIHKYMILKFSDSPFIYTSDDLYSGYVKGTHNWTLVTQNYSNLESEILANKHVSTDAIEAVHPFRIETFRDSMVYLAKKRGGKRALEILKMLQEEWPKIKVWKNALRNMSKEDIDDFENCLNHGFDDLLAEWESDETYFPLLTEKCRKEHKTQELEKALQEAYKGSAVTLWKKIKSLISEGYFEDRESQYIYDAWETYFGKIKYTDRNFRDARNKA